jgi:twitching motility protein PilJ
MALADKLKSLFKRKERAPQRDASDVLDGGFDAIDAAGFESTADGALGSESQRLAKSVSQALVGSAAAFLEVRDSSARLARDVRGLRSGDVELVLEAVPEEFQGKVSPLVPLVERAEIKIADQVGHALRTDQPPVVRPAGDRRDGVIAQAAAKRPAAEISASGQLVMLTQRIGKSANEFLTMEGVSPEAVFLLGKDLNTFKEITDGLLEGSAELRLSPTSDAQDRERLEALLKLYEETRTQAGAILGNLQGLVSAREAQPASWPTASPASGASDAAGRTVGALRSRRTARCPAGLCSVRAGLRPAVWPMCSCSTAASASGLPKGRSSKPNRWSRKPSA